jgi:hypothetical protein
MTVSYRCRVKSSLASYIDIINVFVAQDKQNQMETALDEMTYQFSSASENHAIDVNDKELLLPGSLCIVKIESKVSFIPIVSFNVFNILQ